MRIGRWSPVGIVAIIASAAVAASAQAQKNSADLRALPSRGAPVGGVAAGCGGITLTQSTDPVLIDGNASVYCGTSSESAENWLARSFGAQPAAVAVSCVQFGIDENIGGAWPVEVLVITGTLDGPDALVVLYATDTVIPAGAVGQLVTVAFPPVPVAAGSELVIALRSPTRYVSQGGDGGLLVFGFNGAGETGPTYVKASECSVDDFVTTASVGFPNSHLVMTVGTESSGPPTCGTGGDCFTVRATAGCQSPLCCATVCAVDPACCEVAWDAVCVESALANCGAVLQYGFWRIPLTPGTTIALPPGIVLPPLPGAPFGYRVDVFDAFDALAAAPSGLQGDRVSWDADAVGGKVHYTFDSSVLGGGSDRFTFTTIAPRKARLDFAGTPGSCLEAGPDDLVDLAVFNDGVLVGTVPGQGSGDITFDTPAGKFTFWGFCKGKTTTTTFPDGSSTTETTWSYGFGGSSSSELAVSAGGVTLIGNSIEVTPLSPRMCVPPTTIEVEGEGLAAIDTWVWEGAGAYTPNVPKVLIGHADTAPIDLGAGVVKTTVGVPVAALPGASLLQVRAKGSAEVNGVELTGFTSAPQGVELILDGATSAEFDLEVELLPGTTAACLSFHTRLIGGGDGGTVLLDPCFACPPPFKGTWNVVPNFNGLGAGTDTLVAYLDGVVVHAQGGLSGPAGSTPTPPAAFGKLGGATPCYVIKWRPPTIFFPPFNDGPIQVDEIRLLAEGIPPQPPIEAIEVQGFDLTRCLIGNPVVVLPPIASPCPADLNGNGVVSAADLSILLGAWGTPGGDVDGNGTTDAADLAILLGAWGPCP